MEHSLVGGLRQAHGEERHDGGKLKQVRKQVHAEEQHGGKVK